MNIVNVVSSVPWRVCEEDNIRLRAQSQKIRGLLAGNYVRQKLSHGVSCPHKRWYFVRAALVIAAHADLHPDTEGNGYLGSRYLLPCSSDGNTLIYGSRLSNSIFVRPCPVVPRHGFVDSRVVKCWQDMVKIAQETLDADPDGELLLTTFIPAVSSAVLTPNTFSYGKGHEGATSGKSVTIYGPSPAKEFVTNINQMASIAEGDVPYVELLLSNEVMAGNLVQVRGGPPQGGSVDFVPRETVVNKVITATEELDLLKWEKVIAEAKPGNAVHAPGMSLASHFCVHAVIHDVPVLTSKVPLVGETLAKIDAPVWKAKDYKRLGTAVRKADLYLNSFHATDEVSRCAIAALHCSGAPSELTDSQARFLALGAVAAAKYIAAAVIGEARHSKSTSRELDGRRGRSTRAVKAVSERLSKGAERDSFYSRSFNASIPALAHCLFALIPVFRDRHWDNSYGGPKWAAINAGARRLLNALTTFETSPNKSNWISVIEAWNLAITREHNGKAPALSKWGVNKEYMTAAAAWPVGCLAGFTTDTLDYLTGRRVCNSRADGLIEPATKYPRREKIVEHGRAVLIRRSRHIDGTLGIAVEHRSTRKTITWISGYDLDGKLLARLSGVNINEWSTFNIDGKKYLPARLCAKLKSADVPTIPQAVRTLYKVLDVETPTLVEELFTYRPNTLEVEGYKDITLDTSVVTKTLGEC